MEQLNLSVQLRERNTKNANRRARRNGQLPGVIYGKGVPSQPIYVDRVKFIKLLPHLRSTMIFNIQIDGKDDQPALIRELQRDPVRDINLIHIDFFRIDLDKPIEIEIPVHGVGSTPIGVKLGGLIETLTRTLTVRCLPLHAPESLDADLSELEIGMTLHVRDFEAPKGVEILNSPQMPVFAVHAPTVEEEPAEEVTEEEAVEGAPEATDKPAEEKESE